MIKQQKVEVQLKLSKIKIVIIYTLLPLLYEFCLPGLKVNKPLLPIHVPM